MERASGRGCSVLQHDRNGAAAVRARNASGAFCCLGAAGKFGVHLGAAVAAERTALSGAAPSRVPAGLRAGIAALLMLSGAGTGVYVSGERQAQDMLRHEYVQAVASDTTASLAVKVAMVMGSYYESSYRHIGTPYIDKLGRGQPLTVCNGLTGAGVVAGRTYSPADCYRLERGRYLGYERWLANDVPRWPELPLFVQAMVLDFMHNKGAGAFAGSTLRRRLVVGDLQGACRENERWNRGTVNGVSTVLPGLDVRGKSNAELCLWRDPNALAPAQAAAKVAPDASPTSLQTAPPAWWRRLLPTKEPR